MTYCIVKVFIITIAKSICTHYFAFYFLYHLFPLVPPTGACRNWPVFHVLYRFFIINSTIRRRYMSIEGSGRCGSLRRNNNRICRGRGIFREKVCITFIGRFLIRRYLNRLSECISSSSPSFSEFPHPEVRLVKC